MGDTTPRRVTYLGKTYPSINAAAKELGSWPGVLKRCLQADKPMWRGNPISLADQEADSANRD